MMVVVGLDSTVCDVSHRRSMMEIDGWDAYHSQLSGDVPYGTMVDLIQSFNDHDDTVIAVTARPERWRAATLNWLVRYGVKIDHLYMRGDGDYRPACEVKCDIVRKIVKAHEVDKIDLVIDDRDDVLAALKGSDLVRCRLQFLR